MCFSRFARRYSGNTYWSLFLSVLRCFTSRGKLTPSFKWSVVWDCHTGLPHSEISGLQVAWHLPEAYRSQTTSFIAFFSLGIHHTPLLRTLVRNSKNRARHTHLRVNGSGTLFSVSDIFSLRLHTTRYFLLLTRHMILSCAGLCFLPVTF